jgi:2-keto-4-pentenoate hydratase/2-oxohepta-3-ene-1,7-dioic acid hydratase in catechol pathway
MRLVRFGARGGERPGLLKGDRVVDLAAAYPEIPDIGELFFRDGWLERVAQITDPGRPLTERLGCPLHRPSKIICLGINYTAHGDESRFERPQRPQLFCKTPNTLNGPFDPIVLPRSCGQIDWEVELAVVIGREGRRISKDRAHEFIAGVSVMNDVSGREAQFSDKQWFRGKSFDTFAPMGPAIVTLDEVGDLQNLRLSTRVNGEVMQEGTTADMVFGVAELLAFISADITLLPGDVISTGTPAGVGAFRDPPVFLKPGDVVECRIEGVGAIVNAVEA